jgi:hypothetical protein
MASGFSKAGADSTFGETGTVGISRKIQNKSSPTQSTQEQEEEKNPRIRLQRTSRQESKVEKNESWKVERSNRTPE